MSCTGRGGRQVPAPQNTPNAARNNAVNLSCNTFPHRQPATWTALSPATEQTASRAGGVAGAAGQGSIFGRKKSLETWDWKCNLAQTFKKVTVSTIKIRAETV